MKAKLILILIVFSVSNILAQTDSLNLEKKIGNIQSVLAEQQKTLNDYYKELDKEYRTYHMVKKQFSQKIKQLKKAIDSLNSLVSLNGANIQKTANELGVKIQKTQTNTTESLTELNKTVSRTTLYWIITILLIIIALIVVFVVLKKQIFKQKTDLNSDIEKTRKVLEEESIKLDNKLIELLETQLKILNNNNTTIASKDETDHSLALKVADEIVRIEKNIARMESNTKGLKPLVKGIERIKDNFKANGYEMVQLLGVEYNDGMNIDVINFIDNEDIPEGKRIITKIIKPQVNYNGVLIQRAQVDVSQN